MKKYLLLVLSALLWTACENDGYFYRDEARVRLVGPYEWALDADSLEFSFSSSPSTVTGMPMTMTLYAMGSATAADRTARLEVVGEQTTAASAQYTLPTEVTIPAGKLEANFTIRLMRTEDLQQQTVRLVIRIIESADFKPGVAEQDHFLLKWNDVLSKPKNWDTELTEFFGTYSLTKYRFIIDTLGIASFSASGMSWAELNNYKIKLRTALNEYNQTHPGNPLKDENGQLVGF